MVRNITENNERLFITIIETGRFDLQTALNKQEQADFTDFSLWNYGIEFKDATTSTKKQVKVVKLKKSRTTQFICKLEQLSIGSAMTDIRKRYGYSTGVFKAKVEIGKATKYKNNSFQLRLWGDRLHLMVNGNKEYYWSLAEFSKRSKISLIQIKKYIKSEKLKITFNIGISQGKSKDHGTIIRLYD